MSSSSSSRTVVRHPGISRIGQLIDDGKQITITGWALTYCSRQCDCHLQGPTHTLVLVQNQLRGEIGLQKFRCCDCCEPWTHPELRGFLHDLGVIQALEPGLAS